MIWRSLVFLILAASAVLACKLSPKTVAGAEPGIKLELPLVVKGMHGFEVEVGEAELEILPEDTGFLRKVYRSSNGADQVTCSIVLSGTDRRSIHRPEVCLPAQGWAIKQTEIIPIDLGDGRLLEARVLFLVREVETKTGERLELEAYSLYWFVGHDVTTASNMKRILLTSVDNILRNVNHRWAYVTVMSIVTKSYNPNGKGREETLQEIKDFIRESVPEFQQTFRQG